MIFVALSIKVYFEREHLTLQEVEDEGVKMNTRISTLESEYSDLLQKIDAQQKTMKSAGDQAAAAKASISAARSS